LRGRSQTQVLMLFLYSCAMSPLLLLSIFHYFEKSHASKPDFGGLLKKFEACWVELFIPDGSVSDEQAEDNQLAIGHTRTIPSILTYGLHETKFTPFLNLSTWDVEAPSVHRQYSTKYYCRAFFILTSSVPNEWYFDKATGGLLKIQEPTIIHVWRTSYAQAQFTFIGQIAYYGNTYVFYLYSNQLSWENRRRPQIMKHFFATRLEIKVFMVQLKTGQTVGHGCMKTRYRNEYNITGMFLNPSKAELDAHYRQNLRTICPGIPFLVNSDVKMRRYFNGCYFSFPI